MYASIERLYIKNNKDVTVLDKAVAKGYITPEDKLQIISDNQ